jgi:hypothetical protein
MIFEATQPAFKNPHLIAPEGEPDTFWARLQHFAKYVLVGRAGAVKGF